MTMPLSRPSAMELTLPNDTDIRIVRRFNAPRDLVYAAYTQPTLLKRWLLGPPGWSMEVCEWDNVVGGSFRYAWRHAERNQVMGMRGRILELVPVEKIVSTEVFDEAWYPGEAVGTVLLAESAPGQTLLIQTIRYQTKEARDMAASSGMADGMEYGYQRLDEVLAAEYARAA